MKLALISSVLFLAVADPAFTADINANNSTINDSFNNVKNSFNNVKNSFNNVDNLTITNGVVSFDMVVSQAVRNCLPNAQAQVQIKPSGTAEEMVISVTGLPTNTDFDFFVIQIPNAPFGLSWYQGDVQSDSNGNALQHFKGRFSIETFIIAPGVAPAPQIFNNPLFPDANQNPETFGPDGKTPGPVQTYHLGLWFNSPTDAQNAGCPNTMTPFNGQHNAGIQVLNTSNFPDNAGPLLRLQP
jgi:hypothetical protein